MTRWIAVPAAAVAVLLCVVAVVATAPAVAATPRPNWSLHSVAEPTNFSASDTQDEVVELEVTATEGTYELRPSLGTAMTNPIQWDATAAELQTALEELADVGSGNVTVAIGSGPPNTFTYIITWIGVLSGSSPGALLLRENELKDGAAEGTVGDKIIQEASARDRFALVAVNVGSRPTEGEITITDKLPAGLVPIKMKIREPTLRRSGNCSPAELKCMYSQSVQPGRELVVELFVAVTSPSLVGPLVNEATVLGGGGEAASTSASNLANVGQAPFGVAGFSFEAVGVDGALDMQAGDHPYGITTTIDLNTVGEGEGSHVAQAIKNVAIELPLGFVGDPLAAERCPEIDLTDSEGQLDSTGYHTACPAASEVGAISLEWAGGGEYTVPYPIYNVEPERGYPAELGFNAGFGQPIFLYASVVPSASGYRLRITTPSAIRVTGQEPESIRVAIFGDPGAVNGSGGTGAFVTNPARCSTEPRNVRMEVSSWEGGFASDEALAYPAVTGCDLLQGSAAFDPSIAVEPETTQADTPSGYEVDLKLPQDPSLFGALATPELKSATVMLPAGVSISPSAANGPNALGGCQATGKEGINFGSGEAGSFGQDLGDPEATELGAGHPGGDGSPYDDGLWHTAPGHCPENSRLGTVKVESPLLLSPLEGHVFLAQPRCGGAEQEACTEAKAEKGEVFGLYLEAGGSGVIVKLAGSVEVGGYGLHSAETGLAPGQLRARFDEDPQLPFEAVKMTFPGGQRAALANPQTCGTATTTSNLEPWSATASGSNATPSSSFAVTGCESSMPFKPGFDAGTVTPIAGGYSPFVLQLTRQDGEQDLSGLEMTLPKGLLARLAGVPECGEAEANTGTCSSESQIGTVTVTAGAGSEPLAQTGRVYLTGPYDGGPFGESVVVPAVAGPFNLGDVVVRGSIRIDPNTAQASIVSNPFPTIFDGVPLRVRMVDVEVDRPGFTFNPTDCDSQAVTGTVTAAQGGSLAVSSPFAVTGCADLPFKPSFKAFTQGRTSRLNGASLVVKVSMKPGEANIHRVHLKFPKALPARLSTLRLACTEAQFAANPAGCPEGSVIGTGTAVTPVLSVPLSGPAYLVSHGGAAYPDVVFVLQGQGVRIDLTGATDIKKGVAYSTFGTVPDAPVTSFEARLPEGPHAVFGANLPPKARGSFCGRRPVVGVTLEGQNGGLVASNVKASVSSCPRRKPGHGHKPKQAKRRRGSRK